MLASRVRGGLGFEQEGMGPSQPFLGLGKIVGHVPPGRLSRSVLEMTEICLSRWPFGRDGF